MTSPNDEPETAADIARIAINEAQTSSRVVIETLRLWQKIANEPPKAAP